MNLGNELVCRTRHDYHKRGEIVNICDESSLCIKHCKDSSHGHCANDLCDEVLIFCDKILNICKSSSCCVKHCKCDECKYYNTRISQNIPQLVMFFMYLASKTSNM